MLIRSKLSYIYLSIAEISVHDVELSADARASVLRLLSPACRVANLAESEYLPAVRRLRVVDDATASDILDGGAPAAALKLSV